MVWSASRVCCASLSERQLGLNTVPMVTVATLTPWHIAFGTMDPHTRILLYSIAFGPFFLLLAVTVWHRRLVAREERKQDLIDPLPPPAGEDAPA